MDWSYIYSGTGNVAVNPPLVSIGPAARTVRHGGTGDSRVWFIFVDDSKQKTPHRKGMGPLYAMGSVSVEHSELAGLERDLETLCRTTGFPTRTDEFKWSPKPGSWMHSNLVGPSREAFFLNVIDLLAAAN